MIWGENPLFSETSIYLWKPTWSRNIHQPSHDHPRLALFQTPFSQTWGSGSIFHGDLDGWNLRPQRIEAKWGPLNCIYDTVDGRKSGDHQLRLVVYPIIYDGYIPNGAGFPPSTVCIIYVFVLLFWKICVLLIPLLHMVTFFFFWVGWLMCGGVIWHDIRSLDFGAEALGRLDLHHVKTWKNHLLRARVERSILQHI